MKPTQRRMYIKELYTAMVSSNSVFFKECMYTLIEIEIRKLRKQSNINKYVSPNKLF